MKTTYFLTCCFLLFHSLISAQKNLVASRTTNKITIDGHLDEAEWKDASVATEFTNWQPQAGTTPSQPTEVKVIYDDEAIYIGAYMKENSRDDIMTEMSERDRIGNTDWFGIVLDTYGNATEADEFIIASTGTQFDAKVSSNGEDTDWDAVWFAEVQLTDKGWYAEVMLPYSALRFPKKEIQHWKVNFMRRQAKTGEKNSFQYLDPEVNGFITQTANLTGIKNIKPPLRLSFSPYISAYALHSKDNNRVPINSTGYSYNGGMDVKYGINESFTLDMTLIPDFGQVQSDPQVLNLSPFEVRFSENRPFFTEGTEIFSKGDLFYSRRVGGTPIGFYNAYNAIEANEEINENPQETQLYNASKISGRTAGGLGIGVFNALAAQTHAILRNTETGEERQIETAPLTNYNVIVLDQNLRNNSNVSFTNTNVWREGNDYHDANVSAVNFNLKNKAQSYQVDGGIAISQLINPNADNINGIEYEIGVGKIAGNFNLFASTNGTSNNYNSNDLSFLTETNIREYDLNASYSINNEFLAFNRANFWSNVSLGTLYESSDFRYLHFNAGWWTETKKQWNFNMWYNAQPKAAHDYFEPRTPGRFYKRPGMVNTGFWMGTDNRKKVRISMSAFGIKWFEEGRKFAEWDLDVRYRVNNKFTVGMGTGVDQNWNDIGFVNTDGENIFMGRRNRYVVPSEVYARYTFNKRMNLRFDLRHYWAKVYYDKFYTLNEDGTLTNSDYNGFHDQIFNQFNIDMVYRWRFAPGSDIFIVWKNNIAGRSNDSAVDYEGQRYFKNGVNDLGNLRQNNSLSIRFVYFLDYHQMTN